MKTNASKIKKYFKAEEIDEYFKDLRFNKKHHLGLGDIRLTPAQQERIVEVVKDQSVVSVDDVEKLADILTNKWMNYKREGPYVASVTVKAITSFILRELGVDKDDRQS